MEAAKPSASQRSKYTATASVRSSSIGGGMVGMMRPFRRRRIRFRAPVVRRIDGRRAVAVRWVFASPDQASGPLHVVQASSLGPLGCEASGLTPSPPAPRSGLINRFGPANRGAEGGTRTRTARRPLAPQGFVRLPQSSVLFPSVTALTGAKSDAKASAQRPAKSRPSVANWRHLYCIPRHWIRERVRRGRMEGLCQLTKPHADATCGPARCPFSGLAQRRLLSHHQASTSLPLLLAMRAAAV